VIRELDILFMDKNTKPKTKGPQPVDPSTIAERLDRIERHGDAFASELASILKAALKVTKAPQPAKRP
jgi:hypothetical protein